jgi:superfamily I DNA/RNA helicase
MEHVPAEAVLLITFAKKTTTQLKDRLADRTYNFNLENKEKEKRLRTRDVSVHTIHAICLEIVNVAQAKIKDKLLRPIDDATRRSILNHVLERYTKNNSAEPKDTVEYWLKWLETKTSTQEMDKKEAYMYTTFNSELYEEGYIDFTRVITRATETLRDGGEIFETYSNRFQYILVDEFQDLSIPQLEFLLCFAKKSRYMCVGDDDQSLYKFRGAGVDLFQKFKAAFEPKSMKEFNLNTNYRCHNYNIVDAADSLMYNHRTAKNNATFVRKDKERTTTYTKIPVVSVENEIEEPHCIAQCIALLVEQKNDFVLSQVNDRHAECVKKIVGDCGSDYGSIAVISRVGKVLDNFEEAFERYNIPYVRADNSHTNWRSRDSILGIVSILSMLTTDTAAHEKQWKRALKCLTDVGKKTRHIIKYVEEIRTEKGFYSQYEALQYCVEESFPKTMKELPTEKQETSVQTTLFMYSDSPSKKRRTTLKNATNMLSEEERSILETFVDEINKLTQFADDISSSQNFMPRVVQHLLQDTPLKDYMLRKQRELEKKQKTGPQDIIRNHNLNALILELEKWTKTKGANKAAYSQIVSWRQQIAFYLEEFFDNTKVRQDAVVLSTIHAAKGLEWDTVFFVRCNQDVIPSNREHHKHRGLSAEALDEERKICYVGLTRAKEKLIITYLENVSGENDKAMKPSQFLGDIEHYRDDIKFDYSLKYMPKASALVQENINRVYMTLHSQIAPTPKPEPSSASTVNDNTPTSAPTHHTQELVFEPPAEIRKSIRFEDDEEKPNTANTKQELHTNNEDEFLLSPVQDMNNMSFSQFPDSAEPTSPPASVETTDVAQHVQTDSNPESELPDGKDVIITRKKSTTRSKKFVSKAEQKSIEKSANALQNWFNKAKTSPDTSPDGPKRPSPEKETLVDTIMQNTEEAEEASPKRKREEPNNDSHTDPDVETPPTKRVKTVLVLESKTKTKSGTVLKFKSKGASRPRVDEDDFIVNHYSNSAQGIVFTIGQSCDNCKSWVSKEVIEKLQVDDTPTITCPSCNHSFEPSLAIKYNAPHRSTGTSDTLWELYNEGLTKAKVLELASQEPAKLDDSNILLKNHPSLFWNMLHKFGCVQDARKTILEASKTTTAEERKLQEAAPVEKVEKEKTELAQKKKSKKSPKEKPKQNKKKTISPPKGQRDMLSYIKAAHKS